MGVYEESSTATDVGCTSRDWVIFETLVTATLIRAWATLINEIVAGEGTWPKSK
jgi:hypothetical protein